MQALSILSSLLDANDGLGSQLATAERQADLRGLEFLDVDEIEGVLNQMLDLVADLRYEVEQQETEE
jgi:hypothetical protein